MLLSDGNAKMRISKTNLALKLFKLKSKDNALWNVLYVTHKSQRQTKQTELILSYFYIFYVYAKISLRPGTCFRKDIEVSPLHNNIRFQKRVNIDLKGWQRIYSLASVHGLCLPPSIN